MGKIANMYLDWNIMVVNGHRMVDELVARRAIDIAKEELELQQDVVQRDAPSAPNELCGLLWDTENLAVGGYEKDGRHYYTWDEAMEAARSVGKRLPTRYEWEELCDLGSTWDDELKAVGSEVTMIQTTRARCFCLLRASAILMTSAIAQSWPARVSPATIGPRRWTTKEATMRVAYI